MASWLGIGFIMLLLLIPDWCYFGKHTQKMEKEGKDALEMAKEEKAKDKASAEEKSRRTLSAA